MARMHVDTAVVTGAGSGIGRALAGELSARGVDVVLADVDAHNMWAAADSLRARAVHTDVSDSDAVETLARTTSNAQLVCLNAGVLGMNLGAPWDVSAQDWDRVFAVNVSGVVNGLRAFVPRLLAAGRPAHVLITGSLAGTMTFPGGGAYGPSKHAVVAVAEHAAMALADTPVNVSMICPASVATGMSDAGIDAEHVARQALATIEDDTFAVVPAEWRNAVVNGAARFASGHQPRSPALGATVPDAPVDDRYTSHE